MHVTVYVPRHNPAYLSVQRGNGPCAHYMLWGEAALIARAQHSFGALADRLDEYPEECCASREDVAACAANIREQYHRAIELAPPLIA